MSTQFAKKFALSHSSVEVFTHCQYKFYREKVVKDIKVDQDAPALKHGRELHKAFELYVGEGRPLPKDFVKYQGTLNTLAARPNVTTEAQMAMNEDGEGRTFFGNDVRLRGIVDLFSHNNKGKASVVDYKTGGVDKKTGGLKDTSEASARHQAKYNAALIFANYDYVQHITCQWWFLETENKGRGGHIGTIVEANFSRPQMPSILVDIDNEYNAIMQANRDNVWPTNASPLCGWCDVPDCEAGKEWKQKMAGRRG